MRPRGERLTAGAGTLLCVLLASARAHAQQRDPDVEAGRAAFERADFDVALQAFDRAAHSPAATPETLVEAHRYLASLRAALGDAPGAALDAEAALAIDPVAAPPPGAPPSAAELFDRTRAARRGERANVAVELPAQIAPDATPSARVRARGLPPGAGWHLAVACQSQGAQLGTAEVTPDGAEAEAPLVLGPVHAGATLTCVATLATPQGAVVRRASFSRAVSPRIVTASAAQQPAPHAPDHPRWLWPAVGGGAAVVVVAVAAVVVAAVASSGPSQVQLGAPSVEP